LLTECLVDKGAILPYFLEKQFRIRSYEVDFRGRVSPVAILNYLQDAAAEHAYRLGVAVTVLLPKGLTWVLSRSHLKLFHTPGVGEVLRVRTWPSLRDGRFTCREFELHDRQGELVALATTSWAVLDVDSRRPVRLDTNLPTYPLDPRRAIDDDFASLPRLDEADRTLSFRIRLTDLDLNHHVNNAVYAAWALEVVPPEVMAECRLEELEIAFRAEARYGDSIISRCGAVPADHDGRSFLHQIAAQGEEGKELTRLRTLWAR
jgi:medium-chain acyl-[acyl-carrier-protein] hydrolase